MQTYNTKQTQTVGVGGLGMGNGTKHLVRMVVNGYLVYVHRTYTKHTVGVWRTSNGYHLRMGLYYILIQNSRVSRSIEFTLPSLQ